MIELTVDDGVLLSRWLIANYDVNWGCWSPFPLAKMSYLSFARCRVAIRFDEPIRIGDDVYNGIISGRSPYKRGNYIDMYYFVQTYIPGHLWPEQLETYIKLQKGKSLFRSLSMSQKEKILNFRSCKFESNNKRKAALNNLLFSDPDFAGVPGIKLLKFVLK